MWVGVGVDMGVWVGVELFHCMGTYVCIYVLYMYMYVCTCV